MNGRERTLTFLQGSDVDRPPLHPIVMRWAAAYAGVRYSSFCQDYRAKCPAMLRCAEEFGFDWVTTLSDPYAEASAFGIEVEYPEQDLPVDRGGHLPSAEAAARLQPFDPMHHARTRNRIREIEEFRRVAGTYFIVGWVEGPIAEYGDLRGLTNASMDFFDDPDAVHEALDVITGCAIDFITRQVEAGADCIGIGDAFCSQIGPDLYRTFAFEREKRMVDHVHKLGAIAKLHICGNTNALIPDMIRTGADIVDVDHLVPSMEPYAGLLAPHQVFSGKCDPVGVIQNGTSQDIEACVRESWRQAGGRCIVSAGCEIPPGTSTSNLEAFAASSRSILHSSGAARGSAESGRG